MVRHLPETLWCSAKHYAIMQRDEPTGPVDEAVFEEILDGYDESEVFVHVGLSDVNAAFEGDPYEFVTDALADHFDSILTPAFTKSFRETGTFHRADSEPELGAFAGLFFEDADHRTADPLHSVQVQGDYRFDGCDLRDTFSPDGCYAQLEEDDVRILNVGTEWLVSTQLHYVERVTDVPYSETTEVEGTVRYADGSEEAVTQKNYDKNNYVYFWDRLGLQRDLVAEGVMDHHGLNGLNVISVNARDLREALEPRIEEDPYYLVR
ncbi:AAC(3) family N-acetyltransferase [Halorientalis halophila]|uniref:AAC(3) family N-acetyltransferase n=1 Tax=Halorientalis halophila TaxID=3108499 RepID=UPI003009BD6A